MSAISVFFNYTVIYESYLTTPNYFTIIFSFRMIPDEKIIAEKLGEVKKKSYIGRNIKI